MAGFNVERLGNTARSLAFGRYAFKLHATRAIASSSAARFCEFQGLQWKFADMALKLERHSFYFIARRPTPMKADGSLETTIAKPACNQAGFEVANEAVQVMGAMGFLT